MILSTIIAYARDMETQQHAEKDSPLNWTHEQFNLWRRTEYSTWKQSGAAAAASGTPASNSTSTDTTTAGGDDRNKLMDFNKTSKSEKDYEILKNDEYFFGWKKKFERKSQLHKYKRLLESTFDDTETHRLTLTIGSHDLELFDDQVNFLSIVFEYVLRTIKGRDLVQIYPTNPIQLWKKLPYHHRGSDASTEASSRLLQRLSTISIGDFSSRSLFLQEYAKIIEYYNETNTAAMQANMKLMYLRMATAQDKDLLTLYTAYLSSKRVANPFR